MMISRAFNIILTENRKSNKNQERRKPTLSSVFFNNYSFLIIHFSAIPWG